MSPKYLWQLNKCMYKWQINGGRFSMWTNPFPHCEPWWLRIFAKKAFMLVTKLNCGGMLQQHREKRHITLLHIELEPCKLLNTFGTKKWDDAGKYIFFCSITTICIFHNFERNIKIKQTLWASVEKFICNSLSGQISCPQLATLWIENVWKKPRLSVIRMTIQNS